jgi:hypothetical protein
MTSSIRLIGGKARRVTDAISDHESQPILVGAVSAPLLYREDLRAFGFVTYTGVARRTGFSRLPIPSASRRTMYPGCRKRGGCRNNPTPAGVPVLTMSPGSSVITRDKKLSNFGKLKIHSAVDPSCLSSPFKKVRRRTRDGSDNSSAVTTQGPMGHERPPRLRTEALA